MKLHFDRSVYNSIRVWMYFEEEELQQVLKSKEYALFQLLSIWGGYDKRENNMFSWELPVTLSAYIKEKFAFYPDCKIQLL